MSLRVVERDGIWHIRGTVDGRRIRQTTGFPVSDPESKRKAEIARAEVELKAMRVSSGEGAPATFSDLAVRYLRRPEGVSKGQREYVERLEQYWGGWLASDITADDVESYVWIKHRDNKPGTIKRELGVMKSVMNRGAKLGLCEVPMIDMPEVDDARDRCLSEEEEERLLGACTEQARDVVLFLLYTGARLGEALSTTWGKVGKQGVEFQTMKGRRKKLRKRTVPIHASVQVVLDRIGRQGRDDAVFKSSAGQGWAVSGFRSAFDKAVKDAGLDDVRPHDMRHTFASRLVMKGVDLRTVAELLGHANLSLVMRYSHLAPKHLKASVDVL